MRLPLAKELLGAGIRGRQLAPSIIKCGGDLPKQPLAGRSRILLQTEVTTDIISKMVT